MKSMESIIEHVVVFNVKEEEEDEGEDVSRVHDMVNTLNSLPESNSEVIYLTAGPILRIRSCSTDEAADAEDHKLSHMLHARFSSLEDMAGLSTLMEELVKPLCDQVLTLTWAAHPLHGPLSPKPGSALRLTLFNLNSPHNYHDTHDQDAIRLLLQGLSNINLKWKSHSDNIPFQLEQFSYGQNINIRSESLGQYNLKVAALVVFHDLNELDACEEYEDEMRSLIHNHKIQPWIHNLIHLDYVLPRSTLLTSPRSIP